MFLLKLIKLMKEGIPTNIINTYGQPYIENIDKKKLILCWEKGIIITLKNVKFKKEFLE